LDGGNSKRKDWKEKNRDEDVIDYYTKKPPSMINERRDKATLMLPSIEILKRNSVRLR
jgi:hypothetical protein